MTHSEQINELAAALALARKQFKPLTKDNTAKAGTFEYDYADLAAMFDATTDALSDFGLTLSQWPTVTPEGKFVLTTILMHKSGQWMRGEYPLAAYQKPQEQGSAITYAKRYAGGSALGIAAKSEDDDAQKAQQGAHKTPVPAGYDDWRDDLAATAENGTEALQQAWKASKAEYRKHLTATNPEAWESLKKLAAGKKAA